MAQISKFLLLTIRNFLALIIFPFEIFLIMFLTMPKSGVNTSHFLLAASASKLDEMVDAQIVNEQSIEVIEQVAEIAKQCLEMASERRPYMREVAEELGRLRKLLLAQQHPWGQRSSQEMEALLAVGSPTPSTCSEIEPSNAYVSLDDSAYLGVQSPR